jgi:hypothetical protein
MVASRSTEKKKMPLQYGLGGKYRAIFNVSPGEMEKAKTLT